MHVRAVRLLIAGCCCMQENIGVLHNERVVHRAIMSYFTNYSPQLGRYCAVYMNPTSPTV